MAMIPYIEYSLIQDYHDLLGELILPAGTVVMALGTPFTSKDSNLCSDKDNVLHVIKNTNLSRYIPNNKSVLHELDLNP